MRLVFLNQQDRGQHVNISAAAVLKASKKQEVTVKFLEWLTSLNAQLFCNRVNYEYPVNPDVDSSDEITS